MRVRTPTHSTTAGWIDEGRGFDSPLLLEWAEAGPLGRRTHGLSPFNGAFADDEPAGPLSRRLRRGPGGTMIDAPVSRHACLSRRLAELAPDRVSITRGDEERQLERLRMVLGGGDVPTIDNEWARIPERRAA